MESFGNSSKSMDLSRSRGLSVRKEARVVPRVNAVNAAPLNSQFSVANFWT